MPVIGVECDVAILDDSQVKKCKMVHAPLENSVIVLLELLVELSAVRPSSSTPKQIYKRMNTCIFKNLFMRVY